MPGAIRLFDPRLLQGLVAAGKARAKHPPWYDENTETWMPATEHPNYEPCRKVFDERCRGYAPDFTLPTAWTGGFGTYNLVRFVDSYLPRRNPDLLHALDWIECDDVPLLFWTYKWPSGRRRHVDPTTLALHSDTSWDGGTLPPCCYPSAPEPHVWSELGFLFPEGNPLRYVRRLPWWLS